MKMPSVRGHLGLLFRPIPINRSLQGMKNLEWVFIAVRWLAVPIILLMAWLHEPISRIALISISMLLALCSLIATIANQQIKTKTGQQKLSATMLATDALITWAILFLFADDFYTSAYACFTIVIIEGAMRYGLAGSLIMSGVFAIGLSGAMIFRLQVYDLRFSASGYIFWLSFMVLVALAIGFITQELQKERNRSALFAKELATLAERNRIARELHDTVSKTLQGLIMETYTLERPMSSPDAQDKVKYIRAVCQQSSREIRDFIHELRDAEEPKGIVAELSVIIESWGKSTGVQTELNVKGDDFKLPALVSHNIRQVLTEALTNIQKHAHATKVSINIELTDELRLEVRDNGVGINPASEDSEKSKTNHGFGIMMMEERIINMGGRFSIESVDGVRLTVSVPIDEPEMNNE